MIQTSEANDRLSRAAAVGAVATLVASFAITASAGGQLVPTPDPDQAVRPDPVHTTQPVQTPVRQPAAPARSTPTSVSPPPRAALSVPESTPAIARHHSAPRHAARRVRQPRHPAKGRDSRPAFKALAPLLTVEGTAVGTVADEPAQDRSRARALSLAAVALLLVVIAGGSLLLLTARTPGDAHGGRLA